MKFFFSPVRSSNQWIARLTYSFTAVLLLSTLWACDRNETVSPASVDTVAMKNMRASFSALEGEWLLTTYQNAPLPANLQNKATLIMTKKSADVLQMGGRSFVNWYGGTFRLDEAKGLVVSTDPIVQTRMAGTEEQMQAEDRQLDGLAKATYFELTANGQLKLYLGDQASSATEVMIYTKK